ELISTKKFFLGRFDDKELFDMIDKIGLLKHLNSLGFNKLLIELDYDENGINYFKLYWDKKIHENQLIDLRVSETSFMPDSRYFEEGTEITPYEMIVIEWLSARNPMKIFNNNRPQLPGQVNP